jgi:hypothetical protein
MLYYTVIFPLQRLREIRAGASPRHPAYVETDEKAGDFFTFCGVEKQAGT